MTSTLNLLALLDDAQASVLVRSAEPNWVVTTVRSMADFLQFSRHHSFDVAVAGTENTGGAPLIRRACHQINAQGVPLVILGTTRRPSVQLLVSLARDFTFGFALVQHDGRVDGLTEAIRNAALSKLPRQVAVRIIAGTSNPLSTALARLLFELLDGTPSRHPVVRGGCEVDSAATARLRAAGVQSPQACRRCARFVTWFDLASRFQMTIQRAAKRAGYGSVDSLSRDSRLLAGLTPRRVLRDMTPDDIVSLSVRFCLRPRDPARDLHSIIGTFARDQEAHENGQAVNEVRG